VTRRHDGDRISSIRGPDGTHGSRATDLPRDLSVRARLSERDGEQRLPDLLLEFRAGEIELEIERLAPAGKILLELPFGLQKHRMVVILRHDVQPKLLRIVVLPTGSPRGRPSKQPASGLQPET